MHFEYIAQAASSGIMQVSLETMVPCIFGVLTVLNKEQAIARSTGAKNEGLSWGSTAVEMGLARMSALGLGSANAQKASQGIDSVNASKFVAFNSTSVPNPPKADETSDKSSEKAPKKFGF